MPAPGETIVVGAGPCGLACAHELVRLGHETTVHEAADRPGGLAASVVDEAGFTWDHGGHVVFSHFGEFDRLLDEAMGDDVLRHERSSYVHVDGRWVPYPFQQNLHRLAADDAHECLVGLIEAEGAPSDTDFGTWMRATFGPGITRLFMDPYNRKVWATDPSRMSASWIAERVSVPDWRRALRTVITREDDAAWGPNNLFAFPASGGTGEIYRRLAGRLDGRVRYGEGLSGVDAGRRRATFSDGTTATFETLVSTMPLDLLVERVSDAPTEVRAAASGLRHNSVYVVGVGIEGPLVDERSWLYFPDPDLPFYRVTNFAKYSPANVPGGDTGRFRSLMTEIAHSPEFPVERDGLEHRVVDGLRRVGLLGDERVVHVEVLSVDRAYPVPTMDRDERLAVVLPWLEEHGILSRGRFGAWRYETGNMDHAAKMGVDAARRIVRGDVEELVAS